MRLQRKFSTIGLSSIPKKFNNKNLVIYRPLLKFEKKRLISTCEYFNFDWVRDKSNKDARFERVRARNFLKENNTYSKRLEKDIKIQIDVNNKLESQIGNFFLRNLKIYEFGVFELNYEKFKINLKVEILKKILVTCSGKVYPPRVKSIKILIRKMLNFKVNKNTLHGCIIKKINNKVIFFKEFRDISNDQNNICINAGASFHWDNRFHIYSKKKFSVKFLMMKNGYLLKFITKNSKILRTFHMKF